jgi:hypothetical protein
MANAHPSSFSEKARRSSLPLMSLDSLPEKVRHSALAQTLEEKLSSPQPVTFDYWGEFKRLREKVSAQVGEMKVLFPQFTPHDEAHHLARLFGIADKLLLTHRYRKMNAAELFLLACGLYAHDWGMAVGNEELNYLRSGCNERVNAEVFTPLDDEAERLRQFAEKEGIRFADSTKLPIFSNEQLQVYVRRTHAWRSGVRVRTFFSTVGSSIAQALEQICQGHWLNFAELDDDLRFSSNLGVLGQTVNLRAVALYVRLVDLFDIADDRTPYAIWRFVAPHDGVSQMEWKKHRALSPVTFPEFGDGRSVRFDGSTSDPEVWAELEDLRGYCQEQIAGTIDLMARHRDERHQLDIRKLEWAVTAERFKPVNIRFEFHRRRMFEILADEIYQGDSHVFLRELLQNSIDAVRLRREIIQRRATRSGRRSDMGLGFDDAIYFDVQHNGSGDAVIRCRDYGAGMDEYIVRNYLAVAGVSYYQSDEFRHLGLKMDPISSFGIGILSCFMVATRIEIETCREPQIATVLEPLHIDIPAVDRQFRIYPNRAASEIGTTVTVHVRGAKLKGDVRTGQEASVDALPRLKVTEYLAAVAGFVEFPIVVDEDGRRTVILHPERPSSEAAAFTHKGTTPDVRQINVSYPWDQMFAPQDVYVAQQHLKVRSFDLRKDLGLSELEGSLTFVCPTNYKLGIKRAISPGHMDEILEVVYDQRPSARMRLKSVFDFTLLGGNKGGISPSARHFPTLSVYRNGLLVPEAASRRRASALYPGLLRWPRPTLRVNVPKRLAGKLNVSRRVMIANDETWDRSIWRALSDALRSAEITDALKFHPAERLDRLAKLALVFHLSEQEVADLVSIDHWPLAMLFPDRGADISAIALRAGQRTRTVPKSLKDFVTHSIGWQRWSRQSDEKIILTKWTGKQSIADLGGIGLPDLIQLWAQLGNWRLGRILAPVGVRFLTPPYPGLAALEQMEFQCIEPAEVNELTLWEQTMNDPLSLNYETLCALRRQWWPLELEHIQHAAPFLSPFEKYFASSKLLNFRHPITVALIRCAAAVRWHQLKKSRDPAVIGIAEDTLKATQPLSPQFENECEQLWTVMRDSKIIDIKPLPPPVKKTDFVPEPASLDVMENALRRSNSNDEQWEKREKVRELAETYLRPFGIDLISVTPEEAPEEIVNMMKSL